MASKVIITYLLLVMVLIGLAQAGFTDVPPPPKRPDHFRSREELKKYLQKVHEYHLIVGRWRLRRNHDEHPLFSASNDDLFKFFDINHDGHISHNEFSQRLGFKKEN